jgi:hypothetical protein
MKKLAMVVLVMSIVFACGAPAYARHHAKSKHHVNEEARAAQKRNKARSKELKKEARQRQRSRTDTPYQ